MLWVVRVEFWFGRRAITSIVPLIHIAQADTVDVIVLFAGFCWDVVASVALLLLSTLGPGPDPRERSGARGRGRFMNTGTRPMVLGPREKQPN